MLKSHKKNKYMEDQIQDKKITVLAVDDNDGTLQLIKRKLLRYGFEIYIRTKGRRAFELIDKTPPDILILDYFLEDMESKTIIEYVKGKNLNIPFVIMTGHGDETIAVNMMKMGAADYLVKDVNFIELLPQVINRIADRIKTERKLTKSEAELQESKDKYQLLFESSADPICFFTEEGIINDFNLSFILYFGYSKDEIFKLNLKDLFHSDKDLTDLLAELKEKNYVKDKVIELVKKDDTIAYCYCRIYFSKSSDGKILGYQSIFHDMTKWIIAEEKERKLNEELEKRVTDRTSQLEMTLDELRFENEERKKAQNLLFDAKEKLSNMLNKEKELNEMKTRFISMVSHEYRTPLTVILSSTYLLQQYHISNMDDKFEGQLKKIQLSVHNMTQMLEGILNIGKTESGKDPVIESINLPELLDEIIEEMKSIDNKNHKFVSEFQSSEMFIHTDKQLLNQAIVNLMTNAIKYSGEGTPIRVAAQENKSKYIIKISDEGIGMSEDDMKNLFEPFFRAKNVETISGTGLGLTIVKNSIENLLGTISVDSVPDMGSTFSITLPKL